jgi:hypothetical protein
VLVIIFVRGSANNASFAACHAFPDGPKNFSGATAWLSSVESLETQLGEFGQGFNAGVVTLPVASHALLPGTRRRLELQPAPRKVVCVQVE